MDSKHRWEEVRGLLKDFAIYAKRYYPVSKDLIEKYQKSGDTRGSRQHMEAIVFILQLKFKFMDENAVKQKPTIDQLQMYFTELSEVRCWPLTGLTTRSSYKGKRVKLLQPKSCHKAKTIPKDNREKRIGFARIGTDIETTVMKEKEDRGPHSKPPTIDDWYPKKTDQKMEDDKKKLC
jgi:hypothetical protein